MSAHVLDCIDDGYEALVNLKHVCRSCGSLSLHLEDGWCHRCNVGEPTPWEEEQRALARARENTRRTEARCNKRAGY